MYPDKDSLVALFFLQFLVILATARVVGWLGKRFFGQTQVVGEMIAGVLLGPSLFAAFNSAWMIGHMPAFFADWASAASRAQQWLFPKLLPLVHTNGSPVMTPMILPNGSVILKQMMIPHPSMAILYAVAQLGLTLYMFVVGMEFDSKLLSTRKASAGLVSAAGMLLPLVLGGGAAFFLAGQAPLFTDKISAWNGALYMGAAMCITAFPMLARILHEKGIAQTRMGTLALAAGATDDVMAWALLAIVLSVFNHDPVIAVLAIGGGTAYVLLTLTVGKRLLAPLNGWVKAKGLTPSLLAIVLLCLLAAAGITEAIKLYAVFGAFVLGAAMPRANPGDPASESLVAKLTGKLEPFVSTFLLPVFFAFSGLNTEINTLNSAWLWVVAGLLLLAAVVGKGAGCLLAAKLTGETWKDALGIGILMNARGLMELIILNIGLQKGVITRELFAMMVIMAIVTTLMASPLFTWLFPEKRAPQVPLPHEA